MLVTYSNTRSGIARWRQYLIVRGAVHSSMSVSELGGMQTAILCAVHRTGKGMKCICSILVMMPGWCDNTNARVTHMMLVISDWNDVFKKTIGLSGCRPA